MSGKITIVRGPDAIRLMVTGIGAAAFADLTPKEAGEVVMALLGRGADVPTIPTLMCCVGCGLSLGVADQRPASPYLLDHVRRCEKHPLHRRDGSFVPPHGDGG
jgi:hypothetical protein